MNGVEKLIANLRCCPGLVATDCAMLVLQTSISNILLRLQKVWIKVWIMVDSAPSAPSHSSRTCESPAYSILGSWMAHTLAHKYERDRANLKFR